MKRKLSILMFGILLFIGATYSSNYEKLYDLYNEIDFELSVQKEMLDTIAFSNNFRDIYHAVFDYRISRRKIQMYQEEIEILKKTSSR